MRVGAETSFGLEAEEIEVVFDLRTQARREPVFHLLDLVAEHGIDEVGEVVVEVQFGFLDVTEHARIVPL